MDAVANIVEFIATFMECAVILCSTVAAGGKRFSGWKHLSLIFLFATAMAVYVTWMNRISAFSFLTPVGAMVMATFMATILSKGRLLLRGTACVMVLFVIQTFDYIITLGIGLFYGNPREIFFFLLEPRWQRFVFILSDKLWDVALYFLLRRHLTKFQLLKKKYLVLLFIACGLSYITMQFLFNVTIYGEYAELQGASVISFMYLLCFLIAVIIALFSITEMEEERVTSELLHSSNQMLEKNYQQIHRSVTENAKRLHDFHHHLVAIRNMAGNGHPESIEEYVNSLLENSYQSLKLCHSGCDIIDAIINYKQAMAAEAGIKFSYKTAFESMDAFSPVDICAILSNQIENAFEACEKIPEPDRRFVSVNIRQKENFMIFRVSNSVHEDPFTHNSGLASTKPDNSFQHGLGIRNIEDTAKKYSGSLRNTYADGVFTSTAMLCSTIQYMKSYNSRRTPDF